MRLIFQNVKYDVVFLMRKAGYGYERRDPQTGPASHRRAMRVEAGEDAFSRRLGAYQYPKFHVYAHKEGSALIVNLHLDQKKPTYAGASAHSGEYGGEIVEQEAERIKSLIDKEIKEVDKGKIKAGIPRKPSFFKKIFGIFSRRSSY